MLHGRGVEQARIDRLLEDARAGNSGVLVVRGAPGIGKSALLDYAVSQAGGMRVLRGVGIESEAELPYAALQLVLRTELHRVDELPETQAVALKGALGLGPASPEGRFLVGLATLSLLAEASGEGSLLCLIDDAQWFDQASIEALLFAARRLGAEGIALLFGAREVFQPQGLPELDLQGVDRAAATSLLPGDLSNVVRERLLDEAGGNPLALLELPSSLTAEQRAGRLNPFTLETIPVAGRVQQAFQHQLSALTDEARALMTVLAADDTGELHIVLRAGETFGARLADLEVAEEARLIKVTGSSVVFRHPLIRAAAFQGAPLTQRLAVRQALADALTGEEHADRRAWQLAGATTSPTEPVALELEQAAERALTRAGYAATAAAYERAADLSPDSTKRATRMAAAALAASCAGLIERAAALADRARTDHHDPASLAALAQVRAHQEFEQGSQSRAAQMILDDAAPIPDPELAAYLHVEAVRCAWYAADPALAARAATRLTQPAAPAGDVRLLDIGSPLVPGAVGLAMLIGGEVERAVPLIRELVDGDLSTLGVPGRLLTAQLGLAVARFGRSGELAGELVAECRAKDMGGWLSFSAQEQVHADVMRGRYLDVKPALEELLPVVGDLAQGNRVAHLLCTLGLVLAELGEEAACRDRVHEGLRRADAHGLGMARAFGVWALGRLELGLGRPEAALRQFESIPAAAYAPVSYFFAPDQIEAAVRNGQPERAAEPLAYYLAWTSLVAQPSTDAIALRCRALIEDDEALFAESIQMHAQGEQPQELARTQLLYGEWLRRARRKAAARAQLRAALEAFDHLGMSQWAERARVELRATGDVPAAPRQDGDPLSVLTPQERQVVRLAATGASNRDIAAQLFLSPRTVGYHLYKAFPKLGITSRAELGA